MILKYVITSYSIHYTKLYEYSEMIAICLFLPDNPSSIAFRSVLISSLQRSLVGGGQDKGWSSSIIVIVAFFCNMGILPEDGAILNNFIGYKKSVFHL